MLEFIGVLLVVMGVYGERTYYRLISANPKYTYVERFIIVLLGNLTLRVNALV